MIATKHSDDIGDFLTFFTQMVGREAAGRRTGAPETSIARFATLVRLPLPELYLGYLREFGEDDPVLQMGDDGYPELKYLFKCYEGETRTRIPRNGIVIAGEGLSGERALLYPDGPSLAEPSVVRSSRGDVENTMAQTFRNHLYGQAFLRGRLKRNPAFTLYQNDEHLVSETIEFAGQLGFQPYWFSDRWRQYLERSDGASLLISRDGDDGMGVYGSFPNQKAHQEVRDYLRRLGLLG